MSSAIVVCLSLLLLPPTGVLAWGKIGHEMVANVAWYRLSNETQTWISTILGVEEMNAGSPLAEVADWADVVRYTQFYHWSTPLHYVNVQDNQVEGGCPVVAPGEWSDCHFDYARDCDKDLCAVGAIANYSTRLSKQAIGANASLKFLTHFVGDIHQPLHSSRKTDKGGNTIHVSFDFTAPMHLRADREGLNKTKPWNLHSIWDDGIIEKAMKDLYHGERKEFEKNLLGMMEVYAATGQLNSWLVCGDGRKKACTTIWAEESLGSALSWAYRDVDGQEMQNGSDISDEYYVTRLQVVKRRIVAAGVRLARTLELAFAETKLNHTRSYFRPISKARMESS